jgi:SAM-dependent methyltransferase
MNPAWNRGLVLSYDRSAERYAETFFRELDRKPYDCELLDAFAAALRGRRTACDLGCGPGHVARYLKARGVDIFGIDISPRMVEVATRLNPDILFTQGDMLALDLPDEPLSGLVAFYSLIHLSRESALRALQDIHRVLLPDALLLLSFHGGTGELHADEFLGLPVSIDATLFQPDEMAGYLRRAGFTVDHVATREPYDFEFQSTRVYISATKKAARKRGVGDRRCTAS